MERRRSTLMRPASLAEAAALLAATGRAARSPAAPTCCPTCGAASSSPRCWSTSAACATSPRSSSSDGRARDSAPASRWRALAADARIARDCRRSPQAAASVAGPGHRSAATLGGNLCLDTRCVFYNQSDWWRAANDYCLKRGGDTCHVAPQGTALPRRVLRRPGAGAARARRRGRTRREPRQRGASRSPDLYRDDGAAHLALARGRDAGARRCCRAGVRGAALGLPQGARARRDRLSARRRGVSRCAARRRASRQLRVALTGTNARPLLLEGTDELIGRPVDDAMLASSGQAGAEAGQPDAHHGDAVELPAPGRGGARAAAAARAAPTPAGGARLPRRRPPRRRDAATGRTGAVRAARCAIRARGTRAGLRRRARHLRRTARPRRARARRSGGGAGLAPGDRVAIKLPDGIDWVVRVPRRDLGRRRGGRRQSAHAATTNGRRCSSAARFRCVLAESRDDTPPAFATASCCWTTGCATPRRPAAAPEPHAMGETSARVLDCIRRAPPASPRRWCTRIAAPCRSSASVSSVLGIAPAIGCSRAPSCSSPIRSSTCLLRRPASVGATVILDPQWPTAADVAATHRRAAADRALQRAVAVPQPAEGRPGGRALATSGVRLCVSAGEALPRGLRDAWRRQTGLPHRRRLRRLRDAGRWCSSTPGDDGWPSPVAGCGHRGRADRRAARRRASRIRAPTLALGYWQRPEAQAESVSRRRVLPGRPVRAQLRGGVALRRPRGFAGQDPRPLGRPGRARRTPGRCGRRASPRPPRCRCRTPTASTRSPSSTWRCRRRRSTSRSGCGVRADAASVPAAALAARSVGVAADGDRQADAPPAAGPAPHVGLTPRRPGPRRWQPQRRSTLELRRCSPSSARAASSWPRSRARPSTPSTTR